MPTGEQPKHRLWLREKNRLVFLADREKSSSMTLAMSNRRKCCNDDVDVSFICEPESQKYSFEEELDITIFYQALVGIRNYFNNIDHPDLSYF